MSIETLPLSMRLRVADEETDIDLEALQGLWSVEQYLKLTEGTNRLIEFTDGAIEVLPMPTRKHQAILRYLFRLFDAMMQQIGGTAFFAPLRLRIGPDRFREPDLLLLLSEQDPRNGERFWTGADLVLEVVSPDKPERDLVEKRDDYAEAGIPEYWIVNPSDESVTVLTLQDKLYVPHAIVRRGEQASSKLLDGFTISVDALFDAR